MTFMFKESRGSLRIRENLAVTWRLKDRGYQGQGKIFNISTSGLFLETKNDFSPSTGDILNIDSFLNGSDNFLPQEGRLVWSQRKNNRHVLCGLEFVAPEEKTLAKLRERIQQKIMESTNNRKMKSILGSVLFLIMLSMAFFVIKEQNLLFQSIEESSRTMMSTSDQQAVLTRNYAALYHQTAETLTAVNKELDSNKALLQQTQYLLSQAKKENADLQNQLAALNNPSNAQAENQAVFNKIKEGLEEQIAILNEKNLQFANELAQLKEQLRFFEGNIQNLDEGKATISLFQNKLKLVKTKMNGLKREAYNARKAVRKQRDQALALKGNRGYLLKDGQTLQKEEIPSAIGGKKIQIDVSFVK